MSDGKTFVLVHGAWHGGWCWRRVRDVLEARGHKVFAPTLTGLGERSHLLDGRVNLSTHVTDIVNVLRWERLADVVLCGHSYGGFVVSGVAEVVGEAIASIVLLDAFVPGNGESMADCGAAATRERIAAATAAGETTLTPIPAAAFQVNERDRAWVDALCVPQPLATFTEKAVLTGARERIARKVYIRATGYESAVFSACHARLASDPTWRTCEMPCGHDAMIDMPERLAELLLDAA
jgi:pimeloyl-ACP methyl ester carboxylesterase